MERIKLAISKAREAANQPGQEPPYATLGGVAPRSADVAAVAPDPRAVHTRGRATPERWSWRLKVSLLLGFAAVMALWALKPDTGAMSMSAAISAEEAPVPQGVGTPVRPSGPAQLAEPREVIPAIAGAPAVAAVAPEAINAPAQSPNDQVVAAVEVWRQAWSKRDMTNYLGAYSDAFTPPDGASREEWVASRYRNVGGRKSIDVQIQGLLVLTPGEGRARVSFLQDYTSGSVRELKRPKTLDLVKGADNRWRIVGEWQGDPPPSVGAGKS